MNFIMNALIWYFGISLALLTVDAYLELLGFYSVKIHTLKVPFFILQIVCAALGYCFSVYISVLQF